MMQMFSAAEALANTLLSSAEEYSIYSNIELRIQDCAKNGGTHLIYAGAITNNVIDALEALGYTITTLTYDDKIMIRIEWN